MEILLRVDLPGLLLDNPLWQLVELEPEALPVEVPVQAALLEVAVSVVEEAGVVLRGTSLFLSPRLPRR